MEVTANNVNEENNIPQEETKKPANFSLQFSIEELEDGMFKAELVDENAEQKFSGVADTPIYAIKRVLENIELASIKDHREQFKVQMILQYDEARALAYQVAELLGEAAKRPFTVYQLVVKTGDKKENLRAKMLHLELYGLVKCIAKASAGERWELTRTTGQQEYELDTKVKRLEAELDIANHLLQSIKKTNQANSPKIEG